MENLTGFELVLLKAVQRGKGFGTWFEIARQVAGQYDDQQKDMMKILYSLNDRGLVQKQKDESVVYLTIDGEQLITTANHPFYTIAGEWIEAGQLELGDAVWSPNGDYGRIEAISITDTPHHKIKSGGIPSPWAKAPSSPLLISLLHLNKRNSVRIYSKHKRLVASLQLG